MLLTPEQCRAARNALGWTQDELAQRAGLSRTVVMDFERDRRVPLTVSLNALQDALEAAGAEFPKREGGRASVSWLEAKKADGE